MNSKVNYQVVSAPCVYSILTFPFFTACYGLFLKRFPGHSMLWFIFKKISRALDEKSREAGVKVTNTVLRHEFFQRNEIIFVSSGFNFISYNQ